MKAESKRRIDEGVKFEIMPEIKAAMPGLLAWILKAVFPKLESRILDIIYDIVEKVLKNEQRTTNTKF